MIPELDNGVTIMAIIVKIPPVEELSYLSIWTFLNKSIDFSIFIARIDLL